MKKISISIMALSLMGAIVFSSCTKDDEIIEDLSSTGNTKGDTEGSITFDGDDFTISGYNYPGSGSGTYLISANDQSTDSNNVVSGYPSVKIWFNEFPTKDSTYNISTNNYVAIYEQVDNNDHYYSSTVSGSQTFDVNVSGSDLIVTFNNLTVSYWTGSTYQDKILSGEVTVSAVY